MRNENYLKSFHIGSLTVLTESLFTARIVADIVKAMSDETRPLQGSIQIDGRLIKWYYIASCAQSNKKSQSRNLDR